MRIALTMVVVAIGCANTTRVEAPASGLEVWTVRQDYNNAHLVRTDEYTVLVDAGLERDAEAILDRLERAGTSPSDIDAVVLSHGHADHAGGASVVRAASGAPIVMGEDDQFLAARGHNDELCPTDRTAERRLEAAQAETFTPFVPDVTLPAGSSATLGELLGWSAPVGTLHSIPGHTPGSVVLVVGSAVFAGDLLRGSVTGSRARTHYYQCELDDNARDLRTLLDDIAPDGERFFLGHFGPVDRAAVERLAQGG